MIKSNLLKQSIFMLFGAYLGMIAMPSLSQAAVAPATPTNVQITLGTPAAPAFTPSISLSWTPVNGATSYIIKRSTEQGGIKTQIGTSTGPSYTDNSVVAGRRYFYVIQASNSAGTSNGSQETDKSVPSLPSAPTGFTAEAGTKIANLTWNKVTDAINYKIYNGTSATSVTAAAACGTGSACSFKVNGLADGTNFTFKVSAINMGGEGVSTATGTVLTVAAVPTNLSAVAGVGQVSLTWSASTGASSYIVKRTNGTTVVNLNATGTSFTDTTVVNGTTYSYAVIARNATGDSVASTSVSVKPQATPAAPVVSGVRGDTKAVLSWPAVSGAVSYKVYKGGVALATVTTLSYTATGLTNNTMYVFNVSAVNSNGTEGDQSTAVNIIPQPVVPGAPVVSASIGEAVGNGAVKLSWAAVAGATSYNVYKVGTTAALVTNLTTLNYIVTDLANGTAVSFKVSASNSGGEGAQSAVVSATPLAAPAVISAVAGDKTVTLKWSKVTGATSYNVYSASSTAVIAVPLTACTSTECTKAVTGLVNDTGYVFKVAAVNAAGESAVKGVFESVTPQPLTPAVPVPTATLGFEPGTVNPQITISWPAAARATSYIVKRSTVQNAVKTQVALFNAPAGATVSYADRDVDSGVHYYYVVIAVNTAGNSNDSQEVDKLVTGLPGTPVIEVNGGVASATIVWAKIADATAYKIYSTGSATAVTSVTAASVCTGEVCTYRATNLAEGVTYSFKVAAVNAGGEGSSSEVVQALIIPPVPDINSGVPGVGQVQISWAASTGATSYVVKRATVTGATVSAYSQVASCPSTGSLCSGSTSITDTTVTNGTIYRYVVSAVNATGSSAASVFMQLRPLALLTAPVLTATRADSSATLAWPVVADATGYKIYKDGVFLSNAVATAKSYVATGLTNGTEYSFTISAMNGNGAEGAQSAAAKVTPQPVVPGAPVVSVAIGNTTATLSWDAVAGATSYNLYRVGNATPVVTNITTLSSTVTGLVNGVEVKFTVSATNAGGEGAKSAEVKATPMAAPVVISAVAADKSVTLKWNKVTGAVSYNVYNGDSTTATAVTCTTAECTKAMTGLTNNTAYVFKVSAVNAGGETAKSAFASATPQPLLPSVPEPTAKLEFKPGTVNPQITLTWAASARAETYIVKRSTVQNAAKTVVATFNAPAGGTVTYADTAVESGIHYYYVVIAVNTAGNSNDSVEVDKLVTALPGTPVVEASATSNVVTLVWNKIADATTYRVYRSIKGAVATTMTDVTSAAVCTGSVCTYRATNLPEATTFTFVVSAINAGGEGARSASVEATTPDDGAAALAAFKKAVDDAFADYLQSATVTQAHSNAYNAAFNQIKTFATKFTEAINYYDIQAAASAKKAADNFVAHLSATGTPTTASNLDKTIYLGCIDRIGALQTPVHADPQSLKPVVATYVLDKAKAAVDAYIAQLPAGADLAKKTAIMNEVKGLLLDVSTQNELRSYKAAHLYSYVSPLVDVYNSNPTTLPSLLTAAGLLLEYNDITVGSLNKLGVYDDIISRLIRITLALKKADNNFISNVPGTNAAGFAANVAINNGVNYLSSSSALASVLSFVIQNGSLNSSTTFQTNVSQKIFDGEFAVKGNTLVASEWDTDTSTRNLYIFKYNPVSKQWDTAHPTILRLADYIGSTIHLDQAYKVLLSLSETPLYFNGQATGVTSESIGIVLPKHRSFYSIDHRITLFSGSLTPINAYNSLTSSWVLGLHSGQFAASTTLADIASDKDYLMIGCPGYVADNGNGQYVYRYVLMYKATVSQTVNSSLGVVIYTRDWAYQPVAQNVTSAGFGTAVALNETYPTVSAAGKLLVAIGSPNEANDKGTTGNVYLYPATIAFTANTANASGAFATSAPVFAARKKVELVLPAYQAKVGSQIALNGQTLLVRTQPIDIGTGANQFDPSKVSSLNTQLNIANNVYLPGMVMVYNLNANNDASWKFSAYDESASTAASTYGSSLAADGQVIAIGNTGKSIVFVSPKEAGNSNAHLSQIL